MTKGSHRKSALLLFRDQLPPHVAPGFLCLRHVASIVDLSPSAKWCSPDASIPSNISARDADHPKYRYPIRMNPSAEITFLVSRPPRPRMPPTGRGPGEIFAKMYATKPNRNSLYYWFRRALIGLTKDARRAGRYAAAMAVRDSANAAYTTT